MKHISEILPKVYDNLKERKYYSKKLDLKTLQNKDTKIGDLARQIYYYEKIKESRKEK